MKVLLISLRTTGLMKELFEEHCKTFSKLAEVYCITNDNVEDRSLGNVAECLHLRFKRKEPWTYFSIKKIHQAKAFIDRVNPDVVFFYTPHPDNLFLIDYVKDRHVVAQIHNPLPHSGTSFMERMISGAQKKKYFKHCDAIFVCGNKLKQDLIENFDYPAERIHPIKFGALSNLTCVEESLDEVYDVVFFGRIEYYKGIDVLLDSVQYLHQRIKILIVGKGEPYFETDNVNADVSFINEYVDDFTLARMIQQSKIVVMPYRDATGTSTVIQAFMFKKPVVATDVGVFKEYIGEAGTTVPANNPKKLAHAIEELLKDDDRRIALGIRGFGYLSDEFNIENVCRQYIDVFSGITD